MDSSLFMHRCLITSICPLKTNRMPLALHSSRMFCPTMWLCAYLGCQSHMFELQLSDFLLHSLQFLPALVLILCVSTAESAFHSVSLFQDVSLSISCPQRDRREHALWQRVCVLVFVCVWEWDAVAVMRLQSFFVCDVPGGADSSGVV